MNVTQHEQSENGWTYIIQSGCDRGEGKSCQWHWESSETSRESNLISSVTEGKELQARDTYPRRNCLIEIVGYIEGRPFIRDLLDYFSHCDCKWQLKELLCRESGTYQYKYNCGTRAIHTPTHTNASTHFYPYYYFYLYYIFYFFFNSQTAHIFFVSIIQGS